MPICISELGAARRLFRRIVLSYLCGPRQVYQQSDPRVVYIGYHDIWITDRDRKSGSRYQVGDRDLKSVVAIVSRDRRCKVGIAIASSVMSCLMKDCVFRLV